MVSSAYLRLLIFLPAILIPACALSNPAFLMTYSAYKLNKQGDNIQPWCTPFPIWNQSVVPCPICSINNVYMTIHTPNSSYSHFPTFIFHVMKVKEWNEKVGLKFNIQKTKILASGPITSWQIDGETVTDFIFLGSKITADGDCSHEIKSCLLLGRKVMTSLDSLLRRRDITLQQRSI